MLFFGPVSLGGFVALPGQIPRVV